SVRALVFVGQGLLLFRIDPPGVDVGTYIAGLLIRDAKLVPIGKPKNGPVVFRYQVVSPQQHTVERSGGGDQVIPVRGEDDPIHKCIHDGVLYAHQIARAGPVGCPGAPEVALLVARRDRLLENPGDHVEIEILNAVDILGLVNDPQAGIDANLAQIGDVGTGDDLAGVVPAEDFEAQRLAGAGIHNPVAHDDTDRLGDTIDIRIES